MESAELAIATASAFRRDSLVYRPGYALPKGIPYELVNHRLDPNWYYRAEDRNGRPTVSLGGFWQPEWSRCLIAPRG